MAKKREQENEDETPAITFEDLPESVKEIFGFLLSKYQPAVRNEHCIRRTTKELHEEIVNLCHQYFPTTIVFEWLIKHGFLYDEDGDHVLSWMLKEK